MQKKYKLYPGTVAYRDGQVEHLGPADLASKWGVDIIDCEIDSNTGLFYGLQHQQSWSAYTPPTYQSMYQSIVNPANIIDLRVDPTGEYDLVEEFIRAYFKEVHNAKIYSTTYQYFGTYSGITSGTTFTAVNSLPVALNLPQGYTVNQPSTANNIATSNDTSILSSIKNLFGF